MHVFAEKPCMFLQCLWWEPMDILCYRCSVTCPINTPPAELHNRQHSEQSTATTVISHQLSREGMRVVNLETFTWDDWQCHCSCFVWAAYSCKLLLSDSGRHPLTPMKLHSSSLLCANRACSSIEHLQVHFSLPASTRPVVLMWPQGPLYKCTYSYIWVHVLIGVLLWHRIVMTLHVQNDRVLALWPTYQPEQKSSWLKIYKQLFLWTRIQHCISGLINH